MKIPATRRKLQDTGAGELTVFPRKHQDSLRESPTAGLEQHSWKRGLRLQRTRSKQAKVYGTHTGLCGCLCHSPEGNSAPTRLWRGPALLGTHEGPHTLPGVSLGSLPDVARTAPPPCRLSQPQPGTVTPAFTPTASQPCMTQASRRSWHIWPHQGGAQDRREASLSLLDYFA